MKFKIPMCFFHFYADGGFGGGNDDVNDGYGDNDHNGSWWPGNHLFFHHGEFGRLRERVAKRKLCLDARGAACYCDDIVLDRRLLVAT